MQECWKPPLPSWFFGGEKPSLSLISGEIGLGRDRGAGGLDSSIIA
ncbi:hypothetical protein B2J93_4681 [Marssonina coronariae]|uniref:Uncharacterized protein n=1 Tax=Diplocarpon coronariae TaxID=2795749 RepID=A0A218Z0J7_9HELO|nr:hypothetical protein B2J93_4681 [Marssonina coronariae]